MMAMMSQFAQASDPLRPPRDSLASAPQPERPTSNGVGWKKPPTESRLLDNLKKFKGDSAAYHLWRKQVVGWMTQHNSELASFIKGIENKKEPFVHDDLDLYTGMGDTSAHEMSGQMWDALNVLLEDEAATSFHSCQTGEGAEAWRKLQARHEPNTPMRQMRLLQAVMEQLPSKSLKELLPAIEK
jgi:hypothetical protein